MERVHLLVVRSGYGFMACEPLVRLTGYLPIKVTRDRHEVTCADCLLTTEWRDGRVVEG